MSWPSSPWHRRRSSEPDVCSEPPRRCWSSSTCSAMCSCRAIWVLCTIVRLPRCAPDRRRTDSWGRGPTDGGNHWRKRLLTLWKTNNRCDLSKSTRSSRANVEDVLTRVRVTGEGGDIPQVSPERDHTHVRVGRDRTVVTAHPKCVLSPQADPE